MTGLYQLEGTYTLPFYYGSSNTAGYPSSDDEIYEEIHHRQNPPIRKILGIYNTLKDVNAAKKRFLRYHVYVSEDETCHPYSDLKYTEITLGDIEILPAIHNPFINEADWDPIKYQDDVPYEYTYWNLIKK